jgi:hypothetical protein
MEQLAETEEELVISPLPTSLNDPLKDTRYAEILELDGERVLIIIQPLDTGAYENVEHKKRKVGT